MRIPAQTHILRDGSAATLRAPDPGDAQSLVNFLKETAAETDFLLNYPEEITYTVDSEEQFIRLMNASPFNAMLLAEIDGHLVGIASLIVDPHIKLRHRGSVSLALYREFWRRGVGTLFMQELETVARSLGLHQLELEFIEGNDRGLALYQKMGYVLAAEKPDAIRLKDGKKLREFLMIKKLRD